jgi:two-component system sensor histidine kinase RegB
MTPPETIASKSESEVAVGVELVFALRWWALGGQALAIWPALRLGWLPKDRLASFAAVIGFMVVFTLVSRWARSSRRIDATKAFLFFQLAFDAISLMLLLIFTGGPWNPFAPLLLFHGALGALLLRGVWLTYYVLFLSWVLVVLHWSPVVPKALHTQPTPSAQLFPAQAVLMLFLVGLLGWIAHQLDLRKKELERAQESRHRIDRLRAFGVIATGFSHEFATPLATLRLRLGRLARNDALAGNADLLEAIEASARCERSLRTLLQRQVAPEETDFRTFALSPLVTQTVRGWETDKSMVEIVDLTPGVSVRAPLVSFTQMLLDLLDNALRANAATQGQIICVELAYPRPGIVTLRVKDEGPGFPPFIRQNLGSPFFSTHTEGSGLGLYHAHTLCHAMGGSLCVEDACARGASVRLDLPIAEGAISNE